MKYLQTGIPGLLRDMRTGALINTNSAELQQYISERERVTHQKDIDRRVTELTEAVTEIKELLKLMVSNKNGNT